MDKQKIEDYISEELSLDDQKIAWILSDIFGQFGQMIWIQFP